MAKILIVDDHVELTESLVDLLKRDHHTVESALSGRDALELILNSHFDLAILDWGLPEISGVDLCRRLRAKDPSTAILILTGKSEVTDKVVGFDAGADDYLTKPFYLMELKVRVNALLRRRGKNVQTLLRARDLELEPERFVVRKAGREIKLLPKEFALLEFFMQHPRQVFSLDNLLDRVWASHSQASTAAVHACIRRLRQKIDDGSPESFIENVHGVGYRFEP
ncbi:MAG: response regulator transcription factor [Candidatus Obscuribacterales bacterium]|nr:response regulator transcription factor [Candidatus Obscuribacterales bacterium]